MKNFLLLLIFIPVMGITQTGNSILCSKITSLQPDSITPNDTGMRDITSFELSKEMVPGWNVGNTLEANYRPCDETSWGNPKITQKLMDSVSAAGFKAVRIPVAWSCFDDTSAYTIKTSWLNRVEEVVNYVLNSHMYAIINIHWDGGWMQPTYEKQAYVNNRLAIMWQQIAVRFRDYNDSLLFAGTNEVMVTGNYGTPTKEYLEVQNGFNQVFVNTVRSTGGRNAYRFLAVQGFNTNIGYTNSGFVMPDDTEEKRLLVEVHYYDPYDFTLNENASVYEWGKYASSKGWADEDYADAQFQLMKTKFIDNGYGVIVGEYGAISRTDLSDDLNITHAEYRRYYIYYITSSIKNHNLVPFYWDNGSTGNHTMGLFNRSNGVLEHPEIVQAIFDTVFITSILDTTPVISIHSANSETLKIYPNPANEVLQLELTDCTANYYYLCNSNGQRIKTIKIKEGKNSYNIDDLETGIYIIQLPTEDGFVTRKFVKK